MYNELTQTDIDKMKEEMEYRITVLRPKILDEVKFARSHGDLSENFEYKAAKQERGKNESRIRFLRNMIKTAKEKGCLLMEAMVSTLNPNFLEVASRIDEILPVRNYSSYFCQYSSKYEALKRGEVAAAFKPGTAGALRDVGVYTLYPLVALFGRPETVNGKLYTVTTAEGVSDVHGVACLGYDGMEATLTWSKTYDSFQPTEIAGENGNLILDEIHIARRAEIVPHAAPTSGQGPKPGRTILHEGLSKNEYYYEFKEFADLLEQGKTESVHNSHETSLAVLEIIDALFAIG